MGADLKLERHMETERLLLREITPDDAAFAYELNADPDVLRYTGDDPFASIEEARTFLTQYDHYRKYGFGRWAVVLKETGELLGWCGLKYTESINEYDVGYRFFKKHWNRGYATEAAAYCVKLGFSEFGMQQIVGRAMKENLPSIRVLEKIGLSYWKDDACGNQEGVIYKIEKQ